MDASPPTLPSPPPSNDGDTGAVPVPAVPSADDYGWIGYESAHPGVAFSIPGAPDGAVASTGD